jgi:hypothetical protein
MRHFKFRNLADTKSSDEFRLILHDAATVGCGEVMYIVFLGVS